MYHKHIIASAKYHQSQEEAKHNSEIVHDYGNITVNPEIFVTVFQMEHCEKKLGE